MAVDNATILDKVRTKGTDDYQQRIPSATQTGVANTMRYLFDPMNRQYLNDCVWSMVNRIGLTVMAQNEPFKNMLSIFKKKLLKEQKRRQEAERKAAPSWSNPQGLVFTNKDGSCHNPNYFLHNFH